MATRILGIETSCDETAASVVEDGRLILSNPVASQIDLHAQYGGVFPEVASRQHILTIHPIIDNALQTAHMTLNDVDAIAVTRGPGLPGSLVIGFNVAKGLAIGSGLPLIGINHLEAHIYSAWLIESDQTPPPEPKFPLLALIASGGHTELVLMSDHLQYQRLGGTLDDAAGEAFDKVARMLGLPYPGGPAIQNAAENGDPAAFSFPRAWLEGTWDFSFSGLKTAVLREVRKLEEGNLPIPVDDIAASFQSAVVDILVKKTLAAAREYSAEEVLITGGVSSNEILRQTFEDSASLPIHIPPIFLCTDNAAMSAAAGHFRFQQGQRDPLDFDVLPNWPISEI
ncbi:MAG: tRNA (adenosine(37)-N6)-threonylcarbamoyltransferase complex transferase subunit TsaD [Anaerolineales bacterium]|nr:tRNA (adenosine(37)-N6)-threonylcarbamoyltransferase complex transferase subunit TsaD [Anaerolineales bacterium]